MYMVIPRLIFTDTPGKIKTPGMEKSYTFNMQSIHLNIVLLVIIFRI